MEGNKFDSNRNGQTIAVHIPARILCVQQWYERDPSLISAEKVAILQVFPFFQLDKLDDSRLFWIEELKIKISGCGAINWRV